MPEERVLVGVVCDDLSRYAAFTMDFAALFAESDAFADLAWKAGHSIPAQRNQIVEALEPDHTALWFIDDDHRFRRDVLRQLLSRGPAYDILGAFYCMRHPPFQPVAFVPHEGRQMRGLAWAQLPPPDQGGVVVLPPGSGIGTAGMLIRRRVLDALDPPWFSERFLTTDGIGDDLYFCQQAAQAGFRVAIDLNARLGHIGQHTAWPDWDAERGWHVRLDCYGGRDEPDLSLHLTLTAPPATATAPTNGHAPAHAS